MAYNPLDHKTMGQFEYRGILYNCSNEGLELDILKQWTSDPSDILIASYPKTGTTWLSGILPLVLHGGDEEKVTSLGHMGTVVPYVEINFSGLPPATELLGKLSPPRMIKTHLRYEYFQNLIEENNMKVIVTFRNPKDTITSYYYFYRASRNLGEFPGTFHEFFELVKVKQLHYGDLFDWYKDWWTKRDRKNILTVKYEDLVKDGLREITKIANFCNKNLDEGTIDKIVESCSINKMRVKPTTNLDIKDGPLNREKGSFYRKGVVGDWKNHFNEEESKWVDRKCEEQLTTIGLEFEYE